MVKLLNLYYQTSKVHLKFLSKVLLILLQGQSISASHQLIVLLMDWQEDFLLTHCLGQPQLMQYNMHLLKLKT